MPKRAVVLPVWQRKIHPTVWPAIGVALGAVAVAVGLYALWGHVLMVAFAYPLELREFAIVYDTRLMLEGRDPYGIGEQPLGTTMYGLLFNVVMVALNHWVPATLNGHRFVAGVCIALAGLVLALTARRVHGVPRSVAAGIAVLLYTLCVGSISASVRPDGLGLLLFCLSLAVPMVGGFSRRSVLVGLVCAVLGFYAKPYFMFGGGCLVAWIFLARSKKEGVLAGVVFAAMLLLSALVVRWLCPYYFANTIGANSDMATYLWSHVVLQTKEFWSLVWPVVLMTAAGGVIAARQSRMTLDVRRLDAPLVQGAPGLACVTFWLAALVLAVKMGGFIGAYMQYFYHLLLPPMLLWLASGWPQAGQVRRALIQVALLISLVLAGSTIRLVDPLLGAPWVQVAQTMAPYKHILHNASLSNLILDQRKPIMDTGHTEYYVNAIAATPEGSVERQLWKNYVAQINDNIVHRRYDLIAVDGDSRLRATGLYDSKLIEENYEPVDMALLPLLFNQYAIIKFWLPKKD